MKKIIFFGTSEFAVPSLRELHADPTIDIVGVVTQPDRAQGRKQLIVPPPVKIEAQALNIPEIRQPEKLNDPTFADWLNEKGADCEAFVVVSYGKILPQWVLDLPQKGILNIHGSLLPRWRGASPVHAAIAAGDTTSGVTIMLIDAEMDHGPILALLEEPIRSDDTSATLMERLAKLGGAVLPGILKDYLNGNIEPQAQDHAKATYCKILTREDGKLDTSKTATQLERLVRAYTPWPGTWIERNGTRLKILEARVGTTQPALQCADDSSLELIRVQPEGKKPMSGKEFMRGAREWKF